MFPLRRIQIKENGFSALGWSGVVAASPDLASVYRASAHGPNGVDRTPTWLRRSEDSSGR
jgi:hypothetical protein